MPMDSAPLERMTRKTTIIDAPRLARRLGVELAALDREFDFVVAPIGGGGLTSGIITGLRSAGSKTRVVAAEPLMANDAARSLRAGHIIVNETEPQTIADGARTVSVGQHNWTGL